MANTLTTIPAEVKTFYDMQVLKKTDAKCLYRKFAKKTTVPAHGGSSVNWRRFEDLGLATTPLTEGNIPEAQKITVTPIKADIRWYGAYVDITDRLHLEAIDKVTMEIVDKVGINASNTLDFLAGAELASGKNVAFANGKTSRDNIASGDNIKLDDLITAVQFLKHNNTPTIDGKYICVISPAVSTAIMMEAKAQNSWTDVMRYADPKNIIDGELGTAYGMRFFETSNAISFKNSGSVDVYQTMVYGAEALGVCELANANLKTIIKPLGSAGSADPLDMKGSVGWKTTDAQKLLNDDYVYRIESAGAFKSHFA